MRFRCRGVRFPPARLQHCIEAPRRYNGDAFCENEVDAAVGQEIVLLGLVMVLLLGAYWSMVIFPRQRDFQKRQQFARQLSAGDEVVTYAGIIGRVVSIDSEYGIAYVEIADGIQVRMLTAALVQPYDREAIAEAAQKGLEAKDTRV